MDKVKKILISVVMSFLLMIQLVPLQVFAQTENITVRVSVENNTFTEEVDGNEPAFTGTIVDTKVTVPKGSSGMDAFKKALDQEEVEYKENDGYISSICDMAEFDGGQGSGWMVTANDWFTNTGIGEYTLEDNDYLKFMYTCDYGEDLGGSYQNNDKTVKALETSVGTLSPVFSKDITEYTLTVPNGTKGVVITPTATNKNFQIRTSVNNVEYKRIQTVPIQNGTVITIKCGDPSWPSMNNQSGGSAASIPAETYKITIKEEKQSANITFDADNGTDLIVKEVKQGEKLDYTPEVPSKEGYTFVGWYKDTDDITTEYKNGQTYEENTTYKAKWAHVTMLGAQGKTVVNDKSGIRFGTKLYNDGDEIVEKGTLILPASLLKDGEQLTLDTPKTSKSVAKVMYDVNEEQNYVIYLGTLVGVSKTHFDKQITASAYVIYKDKQGNQYTVYAPYKQGSISVNELLSNVK